MLTPEQLVAIAQTEQQQPSNKRNVVRRIFDAARAGTTGALAAGGMALSGLNSLDQKATMKIIDGKDE